MSGLLRRSKSTRDARAKATRDQLDFNFAAEIGSVAAVAAGTKKAEGLEPTTTKSVKLTRRKSVGSTHTTLKVAHVTNTPPKTADPRNRQSVLYSEEQGTSPALLLPTEYPTRSSSKTLNCGGELDVGMADAECCVIGMAIGSPTEITKQQQSSRYEKFDHTHNAYSSDAGTPSPLKPADKRFGVQVKGPVANSTSRSTLNKEREGERDKERGKERDQSNNCQQEEPPKTGWRKVFGKGFFGSKRYSPRQQPEPATKKLELITRDGLSPHLVPKVHKPKLLHKGEPSRAPCLNVDIPEVEMERYSVMFGTLLRPSEKSTIFARRKSRVVETEPSQLYLTPLKRNATTGQVSRSPVPMVEAPSLPSAAGSSHTPSPSGLARSKSTTGGSPSLSPRAVYMVHAHSRKEPLGDSADAPCSLLKRRSSSKFSKISEESSIDTPRGSFDEGDDECLTKEDDGEPQWDMMIPGGKPLGEPMSEAQIENAAQISIARQISISQRQLLIPIVPKSQRLVSRSPIRKAMVNTKFTIPSPLQPQPHHQQSEKQPEQQQPEHQEHQEQQEQEENLEPGLAR